MLPNLTNQYISYSMALFSANEIRTFHLGVVWLATAMIYTRSIFKNLSVVSYLHNFVEEFLPTMKKF